MKFSKILFVLAALATFSFAEEAQADPESETTAVVDDDVKAKLEKEFPKPKIRGGPRSKEQCEEGYKLLQQVYLEIEKDPKCTYNKEYAEENNIKGDYTMEMDNRDYFCTQCLTKYLRLGNPMVNACGDNSPREMVFDLYFLSSVNSIICAKDKLHDKYCEVVMDELFEKEGNKPIINWKEDSLCGECPYYYHDIFKERTEFYNSVLKDSSDASFIGKLLPLRDVDLDCYKEFDERKKEALKEAKERAKAKAEQVKNVDYNEILKEAQKEEHAKREEEKKERDENKEEEVEEEEVKEEEVKEEKPKKASEAGEL